MYDELSLDVSATIRLVRHNRDGRLQRALARLREKGSRHETDGFHVLVTNLKKSRPSTYKHALRVVKHSHAAGRALGFDESRLRQLAQTAMLHDIGKILVPEVILYKPKRPSRLERFVLRLHPTFGALLASYFNLPAELRVRTEHHHERWDGRGYPHGLGGQDIPLMARVVQVADAYDAMIEKRPYNSPRTADEASREIRDCSGKQFDPRVVEAFSDSLSDGRKFP